MTRKEGQRKRALVVVSVLYLEGYCGWWASYPNHKPRLRLTHKRDIKHSLFSM